MESAKNTIIAIDGYSSCGKSTIAKQLANHLDYIYVDTGAMYRAVSLYFLRNDINLENETEVEAALDNIHIHFQLIDGSQVVHLNDEPVEMYIRKPDINAIVSNVAKISAVRAKLVKLQRAMGEKSSLVMDGRDIGTVVFPHADVKFFITADVGTRVQRRYDELVYKGIESTKEAIAENLKMRDFIDSTRKDSPLRKAEDAIVLDNTHITREQQLEHLLDIIKSTNKHA